MMQVLLDRRMLPAASVALACALAGAALVVAARQELASAKRELAAARTARVEARERVAGAARQAREAADLAATYRRLAELEIIGAERRLEWSETLAGIAERREIEGLRYQIGPRRILRQRHGTAHGVASFASTLRLELLPRHEGELLAVLDDLRRSGRAYCAVRHCAIARHARDGDPLAPRLRASCEIDLITIDDGGART